MITKHSISPPIFGNKGSEEEEYAPSTPDHGSNQEGRRNGSNQPTGEAALLGRKQLALRWNCSVETIKRSEKRKLIRPVRLGPRMVRYLLADILAIEAAVNTGR